MKLKIELSPKFNGAAPGLCETVKEEILTAYPDAEISFYGVGGLTGSFTLSGVPDGEEWAEISEDISWILALVAETRETWEKVPA